MIAEASVRLAIWSRTTRVRAESSASLVEVVAQRGIQRLAPPLPHRLEQLVQHRALTLHQVEPVLGAHHVVRRDPLEHGDLLGRLGRYDEVGLVAHQRPVAVVLLGGPQHAAAEDPDQVAGEVLQGGETPPAAVVRRDRPGGHRADPAERLVEQLVGSRGEVPVPDGLPRRERAPRRGRGGRGRSGRRRLRPRGRAPSRPRRRRSPSPAPPRSVAGRRRRGASSRRPPGRRRTPRTCRRGLRQLSRAGSTGTSCTHRASPG